MTATESTQPRRAPAAPEPGIRVHAIQTGRLTGNETFLRGEGFASLLRRRRDVEFPMIVYVVEHPEGLLAIDAGLTAGVGGTRSQRRFAPAPAIEPCEELGPQLRARGLRPEDVRRVVLTHLDWDHVSGVRHLPSAEPLVHARELELARTLGGRQRYRPQLWPAGFAPAPFDLDDGPFGPFPRSRRITEAGDVVAVPLPGHSRGQVGVIVRTPGAALLFCADHLLRQDWFVEDWTAGRLIQLGVWSRHEARETSRRIRRFTEEVPTVLLPAHDADAPARLAAMETLAWAR